MPAIKYCGYYLGFPWYFRTNPLTLETGFVYSRDGKAYSRDYRMVFLPLGSHGTWEGGMVCIGTPFVHDDKLWCYFDGTSFLHSALDFVEQGEKGVHRHWRWRHYPSMDSYPWMRVRIRV